MLFFCCTAAHPPPSHPYFPSTTPVSPPAVCRFPESWSPSSLGESDSFCLPVLEAGTLYLFPGEGRREEAGLLGWLALPRVSWPVSQWGAGLVALSSPPRRSRNLRTMVEPLAQAAQWCGTHCLMEWLLSWASAWLWLSELQRKSVHCKGMPTSHSVCSPGVRFQLHLSLESKRLWDREGGGMSFPLPSASRLSPSCSLVYNSINSLSKGGSPQGCALLLPPRICLFGLPAALFLRDEGRSWKCVSLKPRERSGESRGKRLRKANNQKQLSSQTVVFHHILNCKFKT